MQSPPNDSNDPAAALRQRLAEIMQLLRSGDVPQAAEHLLVLIERSSEARVVTVEASARGLYAELSLRMGDRATGLPHAQRALEIVQEQGNLDAVRHLSGLVEALSTEAEDDDEDDDDPLRQRLAAAIEAMEGGDAAKAEAMLTALVEEGRSAGEAGVEASACGLLAQVLAQGGRRDEALPHARRALEIAEEHEQADAAAHFRRLVAMLEGGAEGGPTEPAGSEEGPFEARLQAALRQANEGDPAAACEALQALAEDAKERKARGAEASARNLLAQILLAGGAAELAVVEARRAVELAQELGDPEGVEHCGRVLREAESVANADPGAPPEGGGDGGAAEAVFAALQKTMKAVRTGDLPGALSASEEASELAKAAGLAEAELTARGVQAQLLASTGDAPGAAKSAMRALELAKATGNAEAVREFSGLLNSLAGGSR